LFVVFVIEDYAEDVEDKADNISPYLNMSNLDTIILELGKSDSLVKVKTEVKNSQSTCMVFG